MRAVPKSLPSDREFWGGLDPTLRFSNLSKNLNGNNGVLVEWEYILYRPTVIIMSKIRITSASYTYSNTKLDGFWLGTSYYVSYRQFCRIQIITYHNFKLCHLKLNRKISKAKTTSGPFRHINIWLRILLYQWLYK